MKLTITDAAAYLATQKIAHQIIQDSAPTVLLPEIKAMIFKDPNGSMLLWFTPLLNKPMPLPGLEALSKALGLTVAVSLLKALQDGYRASVAPAIDPPVQPFALQYS